MHDEAVYNSPFEFKPERFLPKSLGGLEEPDPVPTVFGWGRRVCPGMHLAEASLWIYAANILAVMNVVPVKKERGEEVRPQEEGTEGIIKCVPKHVLFENISTDDSIVFLNLSSVISHRAHQLP